jgi:hypothetical protein
MPGDQRTLDERYPFKRTKCACRACQISCEFLSGALSPSDLPRMAQHQGYDDLELFARERLLASEGATLKLNDGRVVSLPTLVPATKPNGWCRFLVEKRCSIHDCSPFGCAYIDSHMSQNEYDRRADALCAELLEDHQRQGVYSRMVAKLASENRVAPPLATSRARLTAQMLMEAKYRA